MGNYHHDSNPTVTTKINKAGSLANANAVLVSNECRCEEEGTRWVPEMPAIELRFSDLPIFDLISIKILNLV
jgi:hypothetical protein